LGKIKIILFGLVMALMLMPNNAFARTVINTNIKKCCSKLAKQKSKKKCTCCNKNNQNKKQNKNSCEGQCKSSDCLCNNTTSINITLPSYLETPLNSFAINKTQSFNLYISNITASGFYNVWLPPPNLI
jgi:hypothetical protein